MLPTQQQQQQPAPIKAGTAPGASPSSGSMASTGQRIHKSNLKSLGGPTAMGLVVFWQVIAILASVVTLASLSALQSYSYRYGIPFERNSGFPQLSPGNYLRREW